MRKFEFTDELITIAYGDFRADYQNIVDAVKNMTYSNALSYLMWNMNDGCFSNLGFDYMETLAHALFLPEEYDEAVDKFKELLFEDFPLQFNHRFYGKDD